MEVDTNTIISKLNIIKDELDYIRENMVEKDEILNNEEFEAYRRSFDKKNLVSLDDVEKELGL